MKFFQNASIKRKQMLIIMLTTSVALVLACLAFGIYEVISFRRATLQDHLTLAKIIGNNTEAALNFHDDKAADETLALFNADTDISGLCIYTPDGRIFAQYDPPGDGEKFVPPPQAQLSKNFVRAGHLWVTQPILNEGQLIGIVYVESNLSQLYSRLQEYAVILSVIFVLTLATAFLISARLQRVISEPILNLARAARTIARDKNYSIRVPSQSSDEIGILTRGFNEMLEQIQERDVNLESRVKERTEELAHSLSLLHATIESTADGIVASDLKGNITSFNSKFVALFGFPEGMIKRRNPAEMQAHAAQQMKNPEAFFEHYKTYCAETKTTSHEIELKDGRVFERYSFPQYVDNVRAGVVVNWRDITERRSAERAVRESQALYSSLVEQLPINIYRKDVKGYYVFVNESYCRLKGLASKEIIGRTVRDIAPPEKAEEYSHQHDLILSTRKPIELEEAYPLPDGTTRYFHVVKLPVFTADGKIIGTQGIHFDITQRKQAEAELEKVHRELVDASRRAGMAEVATGVLHNVGNVLNSVNVSASVLSTQLKGSRMPYLKLASALLKEHTADLGDFLVNDPKGKQVPGYLNKLSEELATEQTTMLKELSALQNNIEHIKDIVATQQTYAKVAGVTQRVNVIDLVEDALRMNESALLRHDVRVTRDYAEGLPEIIVDRHKAIQILVNLIRNAKFACEESGVPERNIIVSVSQHNGSARISVKDNGVGIPPENLTRIFNHGFTTRKHGHGFGLHSGALAAKEMRGSLLAKSDGPGKGATFVLELPREVSNPVSK